MPNLYCSRCGLRINTRAALGVVADSGESRAIQWAPAFRGETGSRRESLVACATVADLAQSYPRAVRMTVERWPEVKTRLLSSDPLERATRRFVPRARGPRSLFRADARRFGRRGAARRPPAPGVGGRLGRVTPGGSGGHRPGLHSDPMSAGVGDGHRLEDAQSLRMAPRGARTAW